MDLHNAAKIQKFPDLEDRNSANARQWLGAHSEIWCRSERQVLLQEETTPKFASQNEYVNPDYRQHEGAVQIQDKDKSLGQIQS